MRTAGAAPTVDGMSIAAQYALDTWRLAEQAARKETRNRQHDAASTAPAGGSRHAPEGERIRAAAPPLPGAHEAHLLRAWWVARREARRALGPAGSGARHLFAEAGRRHDGGNDGPRDGKRDGTPGGKPDGKRPHRPLGRRAGRA